MKQRIAVVTCLSIAVCMLTAFAALGMEYNEAPMLRVKVAAGELPVVGERLPVEPQIVEPIEQIGEYGGRLTVHSSWATGIGDARAGLGFEGFLRIGRDLQSSVPNIAKSYEISDDGKTITLHLRKGMKWSDGYPFTADDIMFTYEDLYLNKEISPVAPGWLKAGGEVGKLEKVDDYTIKFVFAESYPVFVKILSHWPTMRMIRPKHYLQQFHPRYADEAELQELAKENGFDFWYQYIKILMHQEGGTPVRNPDLPTITAYYLKDKNLDYSIYERNPYYWKVDTAGNQLPYIDQVLVKVIGTPELLNGKIIAGELDLVFAFATSPGNYPLYKRNEEGGDYRAFTVPSVTSSDMVIQPNQTVKDPVLRKLFRDRKFRQALSLAIDRDEINTLVYFGRGTPMQATVIPQSSYYEEEFATAYLEYDLDAANALLDEMGLEWDANKEYRIGPDNKRLGWTLEYFEWKESWTDVLELIKEYWKGLGIDLSLKSHSNTLQSERAQGNEMAMSVWTAENVSDLFFPQRPVFWVPMSIGWALTWAPEWARWFLTDGEKGEEPPQEMKDIYASWEVMKRTTNKEEEIQAAKNILSLHADNLWLIGTVGLTPWPVVARNNLRNLPGPEELVFSWDYLMLYPWNTSQLYLEHPLLPSQKL